jgi:hypothetical protein
MSNVVQDGSNNTSKNQDQVIVMSLLQSKYNLNLIV